MKFTYYGSICSNLDLVKDFVDDILIELNNIIKDDEIIFDMRLILNELIINGMFHGNECREDRCVKLNLIVEKENITIEVTDEGDGIEFNTEDYDPMDLKSSGRGLVLVSGLTDKLIVENNSIVAIKQI